MAKGECLDQRGDEIKPGLYRGRGGKLIEVTEDTRSFYFRGPHYPKGFELTPDGAKNLFPVNPHAHLRHLEKEITYLKAYITRHEEAARKRATQAQAGR